MLAKGQKQDLAGFQDRTDAHRNRLGRHVLLAEKIACGGRARDRIERTEPRAAVPPAERLVEPDVSILPDAQQQEVDASGLSNRRLVALTIRLDLVGRDRAVGDMNVLLGNVDVAEKILVHPPVIALQPVGRDAVILVEVERRDAGEIELFLAVHPDQLAIDAHRRRTGRQAKHGVLPDRVPLANHGRHGLGDIPRQILIRFEDVRRKVSARHTLSTRSASDHNPGGTPIEQLARERIDPLSMPEWLVCVYRPRGWSACSAGLFLASWRPKF